MAAARKLLRRSGRRERGLVLLEGPSAVSAAIDAGVVRELLATPVAAQRHAELIDRLPGATPVHLLADDAAAALSETVTPQGLIAVADLPQIGLAQALAAGPARPGHRLVVVLAEARDPGNAGTVVRTADAAGADCVIFAGDSVDPWSGKCVRASAGSLLHLPIVDGVSFEEAIAALGEAGCTVVAADVHAKHDLHDAEARRALIADHAWVFGNEAHGLSRLQARSTDLALRVPVYGRAESLNLAAAAAVCLYESARAARSAPSLTAGGRAEEVRG
ncbi:MAG TPA: RNA methyltransferase [Frankiaceae bacterium]|nr:RNA methyltransferase [Frankiaceae bacterium]